MWPGRVEKDFFNSLRRLSALLSIWYNMPCNMKLSQNDRNETVAEIQAQKATMTELAMRYGML
jgi:hypothetical protein